MQISGWLARIEPFCAVMPDGSIILAGGHSHIIYEEVNHNDVWRSANNGATWTRVNASAGWSARSSHEGVALPDGSILLMGGTDDNNGFNDVWRFRSAGSLQMSPVAYLHPAGEILGCIAGIQFQRVQEHPENSVY